MVSDVARDPVIEREIDDLSSRIGRPIALAGSDLRPVAHTPHGGPIDTSRLRLLDQRTPSPDVRRHLTSAGVGRAPSIVIVPPTAELELGRVCVPVRRADRDLGYLWIIDQHHEMSANDYRIAEHTARRLGTRLGLVEELSLVEETEAGSEDLDIAGLVDDDPRRRTGSVEAARRLGLDGGALAAVVVHHRSAVDGPTELLDSDWVESHRRALRATVERSVAQSTLVIPGLRTLGVAEIEGVVADRRGHPQADHAASADVRTWVALLEIGGAASDLAAPARRLYDLLRTARIADGLRVGVGASVIATAQVHDSYLTAVRGLEVARLLGSTDPVMTWSGLGPYRLLAGLSAADADFLGLTSDIDRLQQARSGEVLLETLEAYLDNAGDAATTARQLHVHRATLYQRLHRIEEILGSSLSDGDVRLSVHLGLKVRRLHG